MAFIDAKKLLNASNDNGSSSIVAQPKMFLVPVKNTEYKQTVDLSKEFQDQNLNDTDNQVLEDIKIIREKVVKIEDILKKTIKINIKKIQLRSKEDENKKRKEKEDKLEQKKDKKKSGLPKIPIPGMSFIDRIKQFLSTVFTGFLVMQIFKLLPKLREFLDYVKPVTAFIEDFVKGMFDKFVFALDLGYKIVDGAQSKIKELFGDDGEKKFSEFTNTFTKFMNLAIIAGMTSMGGQDPLKDKRFKGPERRGFDRSGRRVSSGVQERYRRRYGDQQYGDRFGNKNLRRLKGKAPRFSQGLDQKLVQRGVTKVAGKNVGRIAGKIPIVGPLIDFGIRTLVFKEPLGKAAAGAVGAGVGQALGAWLGGTVGTVAGSVVPIVGNLLAGAAGATIGGLIGGLIGDQIGISLYNVIMGSKPGKVEGRSEGGKIKQRTGRRDSSKKSKKNKFKPIPIQKLKLNKPIVGQSTGPKAIKDLYGSSDPTQQPLLTLTSTSDRLKKSGTSFMAKIMSLGIDYILGQKPTRASKKSIAKTFASLISMMSDYPDASSPDITKSFQSLAGGGEVLRKDVKIRRKNEQIIGLMRGIEKALDKDLATMSSFTALIQQGSRPFVDPYGDGTPLDTDQQAAFEKIRKIAEKVGSPNPSVTAAIAMLESGWLSNPNSVYFSSNKTNPFGQTGSGPRGTTANGHAIYNNLEEGVKAHVDRWKQSYKGKDTREIIESVRRGLHGAPGMYNTNPDWTNKVLGVYQSATAPKPSRVSTAAFSAVLPEGNPQFTSGFGPRNTGIPGASTNHRGIDIGVDRNSRVLSLQDGKVVDIYRNFGGHGDAVVIEHSDGSRNVYGHVNAIVNQGDTVKKGQTIAKVKYWPDSRYGDRTHLHLERHVGGRATNPSGYLESLKPKPTKPAGTVTGYGKVGNVEYFYSNGKYWQREGGKLSEISAQSYAAIRTNHAQDFGIKPGTDANKLRLPGGGYRDPKNYQASISPTSSSTDIASLNQRTSYDEGVDRILILNIEKTVPPGLRPSYAPIG